MTRDEEVKRLRQGLTEIYWTEIGLSYVDYVRQVDRIVTTTLLEADILAEAAKLARDGATA